MTSGVNMIRLPCLHRFHPVHRYLRMEETAGWYWEASSLVEAV